MTGPSKPTAAPNRRRKKFIRPDVQLKVVFVTLFVTCLALVVNLRMSVESLEQISTTLTKSHTVFEVLNLVEAATLRSLLLTLVISIPLAVGFGVAYSFRFAGPVYRFEQFFDGLKAGRWDKACTLRKNDLLVDVAGSINEGMEQVGARIQEDQAILQDVKHLLGTSVLATDDASAPMIKRLQERIATSEEQFAARFPDGAETAGENSSSEHRGDVRVPARGADVVSHENSSDKSSVDQKS